ncbi:DUF2968 domain-containing protein [Paraburkholderia caballeronis]|uniref:DUF2968 family protein n=1 Tax=Paraburkholderia caballeronis TaxID=416943 RepID=A0A1H7QLQ0_9BURK|nr:DUF2968 domain-containing protein [Paraburkholderia caballeronis]PXW22485.1 hypothetical protein C7403_11461 [Paraburkholderia caballeronis]PXW96356.1 hypothetical protein C7407_11461 [Paraburkholderia caballeronis]RAJ92767.1 hypothetical protein C7409_11461 [Paraburkholderia caballeronis]SEE03199.1 Protein of unknown function [Paraburkholderia caballeronis]SEL48833.1 Protein of unknown function [Paraburkholderia caballeronis]
MKTFLNRRHVALAGTPSHLVAVAQPPQPAAAEPAVEPAAEEEPPDEAAESARPVPTLRAVAVVPSQVNGRPVRIADGNEFAALAAGNELTTFRVFRSFDYAVSLQFHAKELTYYVALHQDSVLWRALKAADLDAAGAVFRHLEEQATRLADGEARRAQLLAQNEQLVKQIEESEALAERLRNDLQRHASQEHLVTARQHQVRKEVAQLEAQRIAAQAQLNKAHRMIHQLSVATNEGVPHLPGR